MKKENTNFDSESIDTGKDIRNVLYEDTALKSKVARSALTRASRKRNLVSKADIKKYTGGIKLMSIYDTIMPFTEFQKLDRETKIKYLEGWESNGFTRQDIANAWGKKMQGIHDLFYRLKKSIDKANGVEDIVSKRNTRTDESGELVVRDVAIKNPFWIQKVDEFTGDELEKWVPKALELINPAHMLKVYILIKKNTKGISKFNFNLELSDELTLLQLNEQLSTLYSMLCPQDKYSVTLSFKELNKSILNE